MAMVLYVDDDPDVLKSSIVFLTICGHSAKGARNGQEGLEVLTGDGDIRIIFLDYNMPGMNGYDFSKAVKTNPTYSGHSNLPIIGIGDFPIDKQEFLAEFLPKPYESNELLRCIDQYCK